MQKPIKKEQAGHVKKWHAPVMSIDPAHVIRHQHEYPGSKGGKAGMPTAQEVERWRKEAEQEGYQQGLDKAEQELKSDGLRLQQIIGFLETPLQALTAEIEQQLAQVAVTLAQQLVRRELRIEPSEIIGLIRDSVQLLPVTARNIKILINPEDATLVRSALSMDSSDEEVSWKLIEDPIITRGGCEIKSDTSTINVSLENRLSALMAAVLGDKREQD